MPVLKSCLKGIRFPAALDSVAAKLLAGIYQLEKSERWSPVEMEEEQFKQLEMLLKHAEQKIPHYREKLKKTDITKDLKLDLELWNSIPILTRSELQRISEELIVQEPLNSHGRTAESRTSGSTGKPVTVLKNDLVKYFWNIFTIRNHLWHKRDFSKSLGVIRLFGEKVSLYPEGKTISSWGSPVDRLFESSKSFSLDLETDVKLQLEWLERKEPHYLLSFPSNIFMLAKRCVEENKVLPFIKEIITVGEVVDDELRAICHEAWGVEVRDMYSSQEVGYIALQCPESNLYHIQSESVYCEVLNDDNQPCKEGEVGRVIVTPLHNFSMPLIRYELGDYAEVGGTCKCGRNLPTLRRIMGRVRNMLRLPNGERRWPKLNDHRFVEVAPVKQHQFIQKSMTLIEGYFVVERALLKEEEANLKKLILDRLDYPFELKMHYVDNIERSKNGKFEEFLSEVTDV